MQLEKIYGKKMGKEILSLLYVKYQMKYFSGMLIFILKWQ